MNRGDSLARVLRVLLAQGTVPRSKLGQRVFEDLAGLVESGVLAVVRKGAGQRIEVIDPAALAAFAKRHFPTTLEDPENDQPISRSLAVQLWRNAKRGGDAGGEPVLVRGFGLTTLRRGTEFLPVAELTRKAGLATFLLKEGEEYWAPAVGTDTEVNPGLGATVAVVENLEAFLRCEALPIEMDMAVYAGGRLSGRVLKWLGSPAFASCLLLHCGDYDPVGLDEYLKLKSTCPNRVRLLMPENLEQMIRDFGNSGLLARSAGVLARIRETDDPDVRRVVGWLDQYGRGLEQEIFLLG